MWDPQYLTILQASTACYGDSYNIFTPKHYTIFINIIQNMFYRTATMEISNPSKSMYYNASPLSPRVVCPVGRNKFTSNRLRSILLISRIIRQVYPKCHYDVHKSLLDVGSPHSHILILMKGTLQRHLTSKVPNHTLVSGSLDCAKNPSKVLSPVPKLTLVCVWLWNIVLYFPG
jgi:hypothetical protein